jgi:hypothetical protein
MPAEFSLDLCGVNRIPSIVPWAVGNETDLR